MPVRQTQTTLVILATQVGNIRTTQSVVVVLMPLMAYQQTVTLTQTQSVALLTELIKGSYACLETLTYGGLEAYTYGQLQAGATCFNSLTVSTTQAQAVSLAKQSALARGVTQTLQVQASALVRRTVSATQSQTLGLLKLIRLFRRIPQQQNTPLISRVIQHSKIFKRTGTTTQTETVVRGGIFRTVTATQGQSVRLVRQVSLRRTTSQSQSLRLLSSVARVLRLTQAQALALRVRNSSLVLAVSQASAARLGPQSAVLTGIVLQASNALALVQARLTRTAQQAAEIVTLVVGGQVLQRSAAVTQSTNISLTKRLFPTGVASQPQAVALILGTRITTGIALQAQACTLIVQRLPRTPVQPARVFSACHPRRLVYVAPVRSTTFQVRPRRTVFVARFS